MLNRLKYIFITLIVMSFSINSLMAQPKTEDFKSTEKNNKNFYSKVKAKKKKKKAKKRKKHLANEKKVKRSSKNANDFKKVSAIPEKIVADNFDCDLELANNDIVYKFLMSQYGYKMAQHSSVMLSSLIDMVHDSLSGMDISEYELIPELEELGVDIQAILQDCEKLNEVNKRLCLSDLKGAEDISNSIILDEIKNTALMLVFNGFIYKNDLQNAHRIFLSNALSQCDCSEMLMLAYLKNKNFAEAEKLANSWDDDEDYYERDEALVKIVKYYTRVNDIDNAKRIMKTISQDWYKNDANLYLLDCYARNKNIVEFQKLAMSSNSIEFQKSAKFILNIYQNNYEQAFKDIPSCDDEMILSNFVEILCSINKIKEAEDVIDTFDDGWLKEDLGMFFVNAYLKNGNIKEAKRLRDEMEDSFEKWSVTKLISIYVNG